MAKELTTVVNIAGNLENSLRDTIQKAQKQIDRLGDSTKKATDAYGKMQERIEEQSDALKAAQRPMPITSYPGINPVSRRGRLQAGQRPVR